MHIIKHHAGARLPRHLKAFDAIEYASKTQEDLLREAGNEILEKTHASIAESKIDVSHSGAYGHPAQAIVQQAESHQADLIVMVTRGLSDFKDLLLGSVSHRVTQLAQCSVLLVTCPPTAAN